MQLDRSQGRLFGGELRIAGEEGEGRLLPVGLGNHRRVQPRARANGQDGLVQPFKKLSGIVRKVNLLNRQDRCGDMCR